jgi:O-antigen/teichoic acid export membrane protein
MPIKQEFKKILKHSSIYGIGTILHRIPPFILLPIYLSYLSPMDFGTKEIISVFVDYIGIVVSMSIGNVMGRFYYLADDKKDRSEIISTIILAFAFIAGIVLAIISTQSKAIAGIIINNPELNGLIQMALASFWFNTLYSMALGYMRIKERSVNYVIVSISKLTAQLTLNVYLIVFLGWGIKGIFTSTLITSSVFSMILILPLLYKVGLRFSFKKFKKIIRFSAPLIISQLSTSIVNMSDRYFVKVYVGLSTVGIYTLGYRIGSVIHSFIHSPFQKIWNPRRFAISKQGDSLEIYSKVLTYYFFVQIFFGLLIVCCTRDALLIASTPSYYKAASVVPIVTLSYIIFGIRDHFNTGILIKGKTGYFAYINGGNACFNIVLNFILIPSFGMHGAAWATLVCMVNQVIWVFWASNKVLPVKWEWLRMSRILLAGAVAFYISSQVNYPSEYFLYISDYSSYKNKLRMLGLSYLCYHALIAAVIYLAILSLPGFLHNSEFMFLKKHIKKLQ